MLKQEKKLTYLSDINYQPYINLIKAFSKKENFLGQNKKKFYIQVNIDLDKGY